jgi:hypothetical protein
MPMKRTKFSIKIVHFLIILIPIAFLIFAYKVKLKREFYSDMYMHSQIKVIGLDATVRNLEMRKEKFQRMNPTGDFSESDQQIAETKKELETEEQKMHFYDIAYHNSWFY